IYQQSEKKYPILMVYYMRIFPHYYFTTVAEIPISLFREKGIKGIAIDIDNTLTADGEFGIEPTTLDWLNAIKQSGITLAIISNNHPERVEPFANMIDLPFICNSSKPSARNKDRLLALLNTKSDTTAMIGDQLFTDMLFAYRCRFLSILVEPIGEDKHRGATIKRFFEKPVTAIMKRRII
ncbi:MAG: YqeG family HAD IIIA-type phosphatase, partial [Oscillospiraceae bacterium]|nr:YqeG family HAD IIIA-type phosphatase [Oscillospiraceae bacterium]